MENSCVSREVIKCFDSGESNNGDFLKDQISYYPGSGVVSGSKGLSLRQKCLF